MPDQSASFGSKLRRRISSAVTSAMNEAGVGTPYWSATTFRWSRLEASRTIVFRKLPPCSEYTQQVRRIRCAQPLFWIACSPASLVAP